MEADLSGKTILITRTASKSGELSQRLTQLGARVLDSPAIELEPVENFTSIDDAIDRLSSYQWLLFTSTNAVDYFMKRVTEREYAIPPISIAVVGTATADTLRHWKLLPTLIPDTFNAEGLLESFPSDLNGTRILFPRAEVAREILPEELKRRGAHVDVLPVYRAKQTAQGALDFVRMLQIEPIDCIVFTSSSAVQVIADTLGDQSLSALQNIPIAVIGPVTARSCEALGLRASIQPATATIPDLVAAIENYFSQSRSR